MKREIYKKYEAEFTPSEAKPKKFTFEEYLENERHQRRAPLEEYYKSLSPSQLEKMKPIEEMMNPIVEKSAPQKQTFPKIKRSKVLDIIENGSFKEKKALFFKITNTRSGANSRLSIIRGH